MSRSSLCRLQLSHYPRPWPQSCAIILGVFESFSHWSRSSCHSTELSPALYIRCWPIVSLRLGWRCRCHLIHLHPGGPRWLDHPHAHNCTVQLRYPPVSHHSPCWSAPRLSFLLGSLVHCKKRRHTSPSCFREPCTLACSRVVLVDVRQLVLLIYNRITHGKII